MTTAAYDAIADWYDHNIRQGTLLSADGLILSEVFDAIGEMNGMVICDLACGQGEMSRRLAQRGAKVVGIDVSQKLLDIARKQEEAFPQGIHYLQDDAQLIMSCAEAIFNSVICNMALMDISDLNSTFRAVRRILRPDGWFAFTITHPCFQLPSSQKYYEEIFWRSDNLQGVRGQVGAHHRTLSTYINALSEAGLFVERLSEPHLPNRETPVVLAALCRVRPEKDWPLA